MSLRVHLFWGKMISANHFPPNPRVWQQRKMKFSGKSFPVDQNLLLRPGNDFTLSFSLQIISESRKRERESERKNAKERESERKNESSAKRRSSQRARERKKALPSIQPPTPIYLTSVTPSSARRSPSQTPQTHDE